MTKVNRSPLNAVPEDWAFDPIKGPFIREILNILRQQRDRSGGDNDSVASIQVAESYPWQTSLTLDDKDHLTASDFSLYNREYEAVKNKVIVPANYDTIGNEYLIVTGRNVTVTLNDYPEENESVWVTWDYGFTLKSNKDIAGPKGTSKAIKFNKPYGGRWVDYIIEKDYWRLR